MTLLPIKTTVTIQPDAAAGVDGYISSGVNAGSSFGNATEMQVGTFTFGATTVFSRGYLRISLAALPRRPRINSAVVTLHVTGGVLPTGTMTLTARRITLTTYTEAATWNGPWATPGGDYSTAIEATCEVTVAGVATLYVQQLVEQMVEGGLTQADFELFGLEVVGPSNYVLFATSDNVNPALRPSAVINFTKRPALELLARQVVDRLALVTEANGYSFDAVVERPERLGANYRPADKTVLVTQDGNVPNEEESPEGGDGRLLDLQEDFAIVAFALTSDKSGDSVDELINQRAAECHAALMVSESGTNNWQNFNGLAWQAEWGPPEQYLGKDGQPLGLVLHLLVKYRHPANDPFTPANAAA